MISSFIQLCSRRYLIDGQVLPWNGATYNVYSPIRRQGSGDPILIGKAPLQTGAEALAAVQSAAKAWDRGMGAWPQSSVRHRIECVQRFAGELKSRRDEIVRILMWEVQNRLSTTSCPSLPHLLS